MEGWDELVEDWKWGGMKDEIDEKAQCYLQNSLPGEGKQLVRNPFLMIHLHDYCYEEMRAGGGTAVEIRVET